VIHQEAIFEFKKSSLMIEYVSSLARDLIIYVLSFNIDYTVLQLIKLNVASLEGVLSYGALPQTPSSN
jgi:hypothetical protein